jgi:hypothetical protein
MANLTHVIGSSSLSGRCRFLADNRRVCRVSSTVLGGGSWLGFETRGRRFDLSASGVDEIGGQKHIDRKPTRFGWSPPGWLGIAASAHQLRTFTAAV